MESLSKIKTRTMFFIAAALFFALPSANEAEDKADKPKPEVRDKIEWFSHEQGLDHSRETGRVALVYFFGDHCRYCEVMEKTEFSKTDFIEYINEHFVPVKVHFQKEPELVKAYKLFAPPALYFVDSEGKAVFYALGYLKPDKMMQVLKYVGEGHYKAKSFDEYQKEKTK